ncbi:FecR family protein [Hydrogenophaga sp.]|uniref:FecR family protein n=1 Tax=Hydrogenophaga sp. TaxID=1904254 RepID=UPI00271AFFFE|nr:FecR family protein [Hydrogenophaga sp.]MDO8904018.1 FecR family protein [Hydrogenophaga sp.]
MGVSFSSFLGALLCGAASLSMAQLVVPGATPEVPTSIDPSRTPPAATPLAPAAIGIPANEASRIGTVKYVQGAILIGRTPVQQVLRPGDGVRESERLSTGPDGAASILLRDGTVLTMGPDTTMDLSRFNFDSTTHKGHFVLDLLQGSVRVITGLLARMNPDLFNVQTPTSVVGVRGTDFIVDAMEPS